MMRIVDILYAMPFMFFVILLMVIFGRNILLIFVAVGAINWLDMARIVRGQTLSLKQREFIEAARAFGLPTARIIARHIVPNLLGVVVVYITLTIPQVIWSNPSCPSSGWACRSRPPAGARWSTMAPSRWSRRPGCCCFRPGSWR